MRYLGIDFGDKTVGVAVSDPTGPIAGPVETIRRDQPEALKSTIRRLIELAEQYEVQTVVLGYPLNMNYTEGPRAEKTLAFKKRLEKALYRIPVELWDERLSTKAAEMPLLSVGKDRYERKKTVDQLAAVYILQGYLDALNNRLRREKTEGKAMEESKIITMYEPEEQFKSTMEVFASLELDNARYFLAAVYTEEDPDQPEEEDDEEEDGVFIFKICSEDQQEFQVLTEDGRIDYYVTTELKEDEEERVITAFQELDDDFDLVFDET